MKQFLFLLLILAWAFLPLSNFLTFEIANTRISLAPEAKVALADTQIFQETCGSANVALSSSTTVTGGTWASEATLFSTNTTTYNSGANAGLCSVVADTSNQGLGHAMGVTPSNNEYYVRAKVSEETGTIAATDSHGITVNYFGPTDFYTCTFLDDAEASTMDVAIHKVKVGANSVLNSATNMANMTSGDVIECRIIYNGLIPTITITNITDAVQYLTATDSTSPLTETRAAGVYCGATQAVQGDDCEDLQNMDDITLFYTPPTTVRGDGTDGSNSTIGPGVLATEVDRFSLVTTGGTDTVTGATVTLAPAGAFNNLATVGIYASNGSAYCTSSSWGGDLTVELSTCGIPVSTTSADFQVRITPKTHANMPAAPGTSYATTATVTAITATNATSGTDTDSATITVDNTSPGAVTSSTATAGDTTVDLAWTNPGDSDFSDIVILRRATSAVADVPVEGAGYSPGNTIGTATVVKSTNFGASGVIIGDSTTNDLLGGIATDSTYMYLAGDNSSFKWRIEKRFLLGGALDTNFGTSGVVTGSNSTNDIRGIAIDATNMYIIGTDTGGDWRIEKRLLSTGATVNGFGTNGVITGVAATSNAYGIALDSTYLYVVGSDNSGTRIEKRLLSTGALDTNFGTSGVVTGVADSGYAYSIEIDSTYMYVSGVNSTFSGRIEKRLLSTGALDTNFGTSGIVTSGAADLTGIAIDSTYMYVTGKNSSPDWRIEKRLLSTGALDNGFGSSGVATGASQTDSAVRIEIDSTYMYLTGYQILTGTRAEKRLLSTGALDNGFGSSGVVLGASDSGIARTLGIDSTYMYVLSSTGDWRIERRRLSNGSTVSSPITSFQDTGLINGTAYHYKIFSQDAYGNYHAGVVPTGSPATPATLTTTIGDGTDPGNSTLAPGASVTDIDNFSVARNSGTVNLTALTVTLGPASAFNNIAKVEITDGSNVDKCTDVDNPASNTVNFTGCTISVTTSATDYKVRITPKTHANMPAVPGASYATVATVTSVTVATGGTAGTDTDSATITIDNLSPNNATLTSATPGDTAVTVNWTTSSGETTDAVLLRWASATAGAEVPVEGTSYSAGNTITTATVACVITGQTTASALSKIDGTSGSAGCTTTALTNGQAYSYKVFHKDSNGNYDVGVSTSMVNIIPAGGTTTTLGDGTDPGNSTIAPGASATYMDAFTLQRSAGSTTVTALTVTLDVANSFNNIATVEIKDDSGVTDQCTDITSPASTTLNFTGCTLPVTTSSVQFRVYITPKTHTNMPAVPGASYATTGHVTAITVAAGSTAGTDTDSATITVDNASPAGVTSSTATPGNTVVDLAWTNPGDSDFDEIVVLRRTDSDFSTDKPVEGTEYTVGGGNIGSSVVACNTASTSCQDSSLSNGTAYHYKIFTQDTNGNYDAGVVPTGSPATPAVPPATLKYYLRNAQTEAGTSGTNQIGRYDLSLTQGSGAAIGSGNTQSATFVEVHKFLVNGVASSINGTSFPVSVNMASVTGTMEWRYRIERADSSNVVQASSGYSTVYTSAGIKTDTLTLSTTWAPTDRMVVAIEMRKVSGGGNISYSLNVNDASSYVNIPVTPTTTLGDGTDGGNSTIAPGASATEIDRFSLVTNTGSDTVTGMTVTLAPANSYNNIATVDVQNIDVLNDFYIESEQDAFGQLYNGNVTKTGQSFTSIGNKLLNAKFYLKKTGTPTGNATAVLYAHSGTFGTNSAPTGAALATSDVFDVSTLTTSYQLTNFNFTGGQQYTMSNGTNYVIALEYANGDGSNFVNTGIDTSSPSHSGNRSTYNGTWSGGSGSDIIFYVYSGGVSKCSSSSWGSDLTVELTSCGISVTTTPTEYVVKVTPKTHANMPAVPGASYATTATVTALTLTGLSTGTDTDSATITTDNLSPGNAGGWTARSAAGNDDGWSAVTYGAADDLFVAVGTSGDRVMTSPDGTTWTARSAAGDDDSWQGITYSSADDLFVAVGPSGTNRAMTSSNGTTWTGLTGVAGDNDNWQSVTYSAADDLFVAVGEAGTDRVMTSPDGTTWTARSAAGNDDAWREVTYSSSEDLFVAVAVSGTDRVMTSPDGINWTARSAAGNNDNWESVTYSTADDLFVVVGGGTDRVMTSPDGTTWTVQSAAGGDDAWYGVTYGAADDQFVAVGSGPDRVMTSPDGINWTVQSAAEDDDVWIGVTYSSNEDLFVAVGQSGDDRVMTSSQISLTPGDTVVDLAWANPTDSDFDEIIVLRHTSAIVATPTEGTEYSVSDTIGSATVVCNTVSTSCQDTSLSNGTPYHYKIYAQDTNGNYDTGTVPNGSPATPTVIQTTLSDGTDPGNSTIAPGASVTDIDAFTLQRSTGSTSVTALTVTLSPASSFNNISKVEITDGSNADECTDIDNPSSVTLNFTGCSLAVTTSSTPFKVRITPKTHTNMPAVPGASYATTATVTAITVAAGSTTGTDTDSATITTDNLSPNADAGTTWTARSAAEANTWYSVTYGNGLYVAVSYGGTNRVMTSPDGITWTARSASEANGWYSVTYGNGLFVAVSQTGTNRVMTSPDGTTWTARAASEANTWNSVTYGNGLYVAVSSDGTNRVMTSPDGITWTARSASQANSWNSVTYGNGLFVAVSTDGTNRVMTSPDGITWTARSASEANGWLDVTYGNGLFVAVAYTGTNRVMTSPDGTTWTARSAAEANSWISVAYGNGLYVAVSTGGTNRVMTSPDGTTWTVRSAAEANTWQSVAYGNGLFVAVAYTGTNRVMTSPSFPPSTATAGNTVVDLAWTNAVDADFDEVIILRHTSAIVAVPVEGTEYSVTDPIGSATVVCNTASTSCQDTGLTNDTPYHYKIFTQDTRGNYDSGVVPDGSPATPVALTTTLGDGTDPGNSTIAPEAAVTDIDAFTLQRNSGSTSVTALTVTLSPADSFNNISKVEITDGSNVDECTDIDNPASVTLNFTGCSLAVTTSSTPFKVRITPKTHANMAAVPGASYATTATVTAITVGAGSTTGTDTDSATITTDNLSPNSSYATTWTARSASQANIWNSVAYGNGTFVAVSADGTNRVMTSPTGETWTARVAAEANSWRGVTYGSGLFVAVSTDGTNRVMTSPDGTTWTARAAAEANPWTSVTYGNGLYVAVSTTGTNRVMTSPDGITWTARSASEANSWQSVTYGNSIFVAISADGTNRVMTSSDGITWSPQSASEANGWYSVTYGGSTFVAVSFSGTNRVMTSPDGVTWTARSASEANSWRAVTYGGGLFVATSIDGTNRVMTSPTGTTWTARSASEANSWFSIAYGNGIFVSAAYDGTNQVMTSSAPVYATATPGNTIVDLAWTNPADSDFTTGGTVVVLRRATSAVADVPVEGTTYAVGNTIGTATVACKVSGSPPTGSCQDASLTNDTAYHYKVFTEDSNGNYDAGTVPDGSPATPAVLTTTLADGTDPGNSTIAPGATVTDMDAFTIQRNTGSANLTALTVTLAPANSFNNISKVEITNASNVDKCTDVDNPSSTTVNFTGCTISATTSLTDYKVRITPKTHANMAAVPGASYATTATVTSITVSAGGTAGTDTDSATITTDNLSPNSLWTARSAAEANNWVAVTHGDGLFVAVATDGTNLVMTSPDGTTWTARAAAEANEWKSVTYGNGLFVAVTGNGTNRVMTSPDGITWTARSAAEANFWTGVTYGNGLFVAVSGSGTNRVMTSPDGITWTARSAAGNDDSWAAVTYGNGLYVAVGSGAGDFVMTSPDGITWTARTAADSVSWNSVAYGNGMYVAVTTLNTGTYAIMSSPDAINWTGRDDNTDFRGVTYGAGNFITVDTGRVRKSTDGITWINQNSPEENQWQAVTYGEGLFVAVANTGTNRVMTATLTNGTATPGNTVVDLAWTNAGDSDFDEVIVLRRASSAVTDVPTEGVEYTSGALGSSTVVCNTSSTSCQDSSLSNGVAYHYKIFTQDTNGNYDSGIVPEGSPATPANLTTTLGDGTDPGNSTIAPGASATDIDAFSLERASGSTTLTALTVTLTPANSFNNIAKVEITDSSNVDKCTDVDNPSSTTVNFTGCTISVTTTPTDYKVRITPKTHTNMPAVPGASYATTATVTSITVAAGPTTGTDTDSATITTDNLSPNADAGATWTPRSASEANIWNSVTYGNGLYVAVSGDGTNRVMTSPDGITWTARAASEANGWYSVTYGNGLYVAVSGDGTNRVMTSPDGTTWTARSAATASQWISVTYGNGLYVAIANIGANRVMTSPDGITWTARSATEANNWLGVTYGNGLFVAVSFDGTNRVMTSPDGITWTARSASEANGWISITYGNGLFVAVAQSGTNRVMTSPDGITWTARAATEANDWKSVTYGNGLYVAVSENGTNRVMTSPDGITWTARSASAGNDWNSVTYGNGLYVAVSGDGTNRVMTSPGFPTSTVTPGNTVADLSWTNAGDADFDEVIILRHTSAIIDAPIEGTEYVVTNTIGSATVVCNTASTTCQDTGLSNNTAYYYRIFAQDTNGNYDSGTVPTGSPSTPAVITLGDGTDPGNSTIAPGASVTDIDRFSLAVGGGTDTVTQVYITLSPANSFNNISKVEITDTSNVDVCTDVDNPASVTVNFTTCTIPVTTSTVEYKVRITPKTHVNMPAPPGTGYATTATVTDIVATRTETGTDTDSATITTDNLSPNASATWTARSAAEANGWVSVTYGNDLYVAVSNTGDNQAMTSPDGITWTARSTPGTDQAWTSVTYGNGLFVAVSFDGTDRVMTSPDGITWTARTATEQNAWNGVTYGNGLFVAVSQGGTNRVMTSPDGITWTAESAAEANAWFDVTYGNGLFVAVAGSGTNRVMTSPDGETWTARSASEANSWFSVAYGNGLYVAISYSGTNRVMTSPDGVTWTARSASEANNWNRVIYGNGQFVAVSSTGTNRVMTSPDGITWTARSAAQANNWFGVTYGNGTLVAVASTGTNRVMTSPGFPTSTVTPGNTVADLSWTNAGDADFDEVIILRHTSAITDAPVEGTEYSAGNSVGSATVACNTVSTTCQDTSLTNGTPYHYKIFSQDTNGNYDSGTVPEGSPATPVVLTTTLGDGTDPGNSTIIPGATVTDIDAFTLQRNSGSTSVTALTVTLGVAGSFNNISKIEITDGSNVDECTDVDNPSSVTVNFTGCSLAVTTSSTPFKVRITPKTHANMPAVPGESFATTATVTSITVGVGSTAGTDTDSGIITVDNLSPNSTSPWTARSAANNDDNWMDVTYGNSTFVAVGYSGDRVMTSPDGITWTARTAAGNNDNWRSVVYAEGLFVAVAWGSVGGEPVMTSPDGITWTVRSAGGDNDDWNGVTYGNGTFVAVGDLGDRAMYSDDGITWTTVSAAGNNDGWQGVAYGNGLFTAVGWSGDLVMTSPDGITWTPRSAAGNDDSWYDVIFAGNQFVAVGDAGDIVMTSPDGINWTARSALGDNENWTDITYGSGLYVAVSYGFGERVMISPDGINWTARPAAGDNDSWYGVTYNAGQFVAVGLSGSDRVMTSGAMVYGTATPGNTVVDLAWTNAADSDFDEIIILRHTSAITDAPVEGTEYSVSNTIGSATVVCNSASTTCQDTSLTNDVPYHYKIFTQDSNGNYDSGVVPTGSPATPIAPLTLTQGAHRIFENIDGPVAFDTDGKLTGAATSSGDYFTDIAKDGTYMYIASMDDNSDWRIEKRLLTTGALDSGFGSSGIATSASGLRVGGIAIDDTYMYLVGENSTPDWRIEKRKLTNGNLCTAGECGIQFGTNGVVTGDSSTIEAYTVAIDDTYMYVFGAGANNDWRTEKRYLSDGTLASQFGVGGVITHHSETDYSLGDMAMGIDDTYMYLAGLGAGSTMRIEKRFLSHGALETDFGTNGIVTDSSITEPSGGDVLVDNTHLYVAGRQSADTTKAEKRFKSTGALVNGFGSSGVQTLSAARTSAVAKDDVYLFTAGRNSGSDMTIEKRLLSDGSLDTGFGTSGVVTSDASTTTANSIVMDGGTLYVHGTDSNLDMRLEKLFKGNGSLVDATKPAVGMPLAAENTATTLTGSGQAFRLRLLIHAGGSALSQSGETFKLQYAAKSGTCDAGFSGESYADITTGTPISFYNNTNLADGDLPSATPLDPSDDYTKVTQLYEEANNFTNSVGAIPTGQDGMWDFALYDNGASQGSSHCIRVVKSTGTVLDSYTAIPEVSTPSALLTQFGYIWRNDNSSETNAAYLLDRNIPLDKNFYAGDNRRLRIGISNTGYATATSTQYRLEYASGVCSAWSTVPNSAGGAPWTMVSSANVSNGAATTDSAPLKNPANKTFVAGQVMTTSNITSGITLTPSQFTEIEYNIEPTTNVVIDTNYCFRVTNAGSSTGLTYSEQPQAKAFSFVFIPRTGGAGGAGGEGSGSGEQVGGGTPSGGGGSTTATGTATISGGIVTGVNITSGGSGYTTPPSVAFCGGGGSGATGTAVLTNNAVSSVNIGNGGSNYSSAPSVLFGGTCGGSGGGAGGGDSGFNYGKSTLASTAEIPVPTTSLFKFLFSGFPWW